MYKRLQSGSFFAPFLFAPVTNLLFLYTKGLPFDIPGAWHEVKREHKLTIEIRQNFLHSQISNLICTQIIASSSFHEIQTI